MPAPGIVSSCRGTGIETRLTGFADLEPGLPRDRGIWAKFALMNPPVDDLVAGAAGALLRGSVFHRGQPTDMDGTNCITAVRATPWRMLKASVPATRAACQGRAA